MGGLSCEGAAIGSDTSYVMEIEMNEHRSAPLVLIAALFLVSYISAGARAQERTADIQELRIVRSLAQNWKFTLDDAMSDEAALRASGAQWKTVALPHTWNARDAAGMNVTEPYHRGLGWYRLEFDTPAPGARHWLEFGAASMVADVWLNGRKLGQHKGAFTAFRFDVTEHLAKDGRNVLLVKVDNSEPKANGERTAIIPLGGDFNMSGGLYRYVWLVSTAAPAAIDLGDLGASGVYAATTSIENGAATVNVRTKVRNDGREAGEYVVRAFLVGADGRVAQSAERPVTLKAGARAEVAQDLKVENPRLWQGVEDPYQYRLVVDLLRPGGGAVDRVMHEFGIRQMAFHPDRGFFLNGKHVRLRGVAMHQDYLHKGWAVSTAEMEESMALVKEIGANTLRFGHYPFDPYVYALANRMGLVVWSEVPVSLGMTTEVLVTAGQPQGGPTCPKLDPRQEYVANARMQLQEIVRQQFNHASVGMWSVGNETTFMHKDCEETWYDNVTPVLRELHRLAKLEDPQRATTLADFTEKVETPLAGGYIAVGGNTDIWAINNYYLWYAGAVTQLRDLLDALRVRYPGQPIGMSEYGAGGALSHHTDNVRGGPPEVVNTGVQVVYQPEEYASYAHEQNYAILDSREYLWGTYVWNMFDFGSGLRNEGDMRGVNTKGLVSFDRKTKKDPFFFYKANWSREPVTYITSRRYVERAYAVTDVKVYSNADSVELVLNGKPVGALRQEQCVMKACVFRNVRLGAGQNRLEAVGDHGGRRVADTVEWRFDNQGVHIAAGQIATGFKAASGERFGSDEFFIGGDAGWLVPKSYAPIEDITEVRGTKDAALYKNYRRGHFSYDIPLADGTYEVTLRFLEPHGNTGVGHRLFDVMANGEKKLENFDALRAAGTYRTAVMRSFHAEAANGRLRLDFVPIRGEALVSSISVREASAAAGRTAQPAAEKPPRDEMRASAILGREVENRQRQDLGKIGDLLIDDGAVVLQYARAGDAQPKPVAYRLDALDTGVDSENLVLDAKPDVLRRAPAQEPAGLRASELIGRRVNGREVRDLIVDLRRGAVTEAVVLQEGRESRVPINQLLVEKR
jgi:beta-galactosidase